MIYYGLRQICQFPGADSEYVVWPCLHLPLFLASADTFGLQTLLLPAGFAFLDPDRDNTLQIWSSRFSFPVPVAPLDSRQQNWDEPAITTVLGALNQLPDPAHKRVF